MYKKSSQYHNKNQKWNRTKKKSLNNSKLVDRTGGIGYDVKYVRTKRGVKRQIIK